MNGKRQPIQEEKTPWMRLKTLLDTHQSVILDREKENEKFVHLYETGGYWAAFEQSAYRLCRIFPDCETSVVRFATYPFPVVMASVPDRELHGYSRRHILQTIEPDYKVLLSTPLRPEHYRDWHRTEIQEFM